MKTHNGRHYSEWPPIVASRLRRFNAGMATERPAHVALWFVLLAAVSFALSAVGTIVRSKLWLGPQTLVLGVIGIGFALGIAILSWRWALSRRAALLDGLPWSSTRAAALAVACFAAGVLILTVGFGGFANSADEYGFLFTARTLADFHLSLPAPPHPELLDQQYLLAHDGRWVSQYLPGWPAVMALFEIVHLPPWLAAPACGALLMLALWQALRMECKSPQLTAALLLSFATSGFFLLNAGTYFSHCASTLAVVAAVLCMLRAEHDSHWAWPAAAGVCVGYALLCRIDTFAIAGFAAFAAWLEQGMKRRTLLLGLAGFAPLVVLYGAYDWAITGVWFEPPTVWAGFMSFSHGLSGPEAPMGRFRVIVQTLWRLGELADTASLLVPALYVSALVWRIRARRIRFYDTLPIVNFIIFLIYPDLGGFQMGPRYWFDGYVLMHLTIGNVFAAEDIAWRRFAVACCVLLVPVSLARLPAQIAFHARQMHERSAMYRLGDALPADQSAVVLVNDFPSAWNERANRTDLNLAKDFARNMPPFDAHVLYGRGDLPDAAERACRDYPNRRVFNFHLDKAHPDGWLAPVDCHAG